VTEGAADGRLRHTQAGGAMCAGPCAAQQAGPRRHRDAERPTNNHGGSTGAGCARSEATAQPVTVRRIGVNARVADVASRASGSALLHVGALVLCLIQQVVEKWPTWIIQQRGILAFDMTQFQRTSVRTVFDGAHAIENRKEAENSPVR